MDDYPRQLPLSFDIQTGFDLDDLVVTKSNRAAFELVEQWPDWSLPVALLVGPEGTGKTHFATVWCQKSGAFVADFDCMEKGIEQARRGVPVLLENISESRLDETALFHLFNTVRQAHSVNPRATLLLTSQTSPSNWGLGLLDLASRMKAVTFIELSQPDDTLLVAVLIKLFSDRQLAVDLAIITYIVSRMERSLSVARRLVEAIDAKALAQKSKITRPLVADVLTTFREVDAESIA